MTKKQLISFILIANIIFNIFCFNNMVVMATEENPEENAEENFDLNENVNAQLDQIKEIGLPGREKSEDEILEVVTDVIKMLLGLLGLIFLIIIIYAGFRWMTAGGNEEGIGKSKKLIGNALIGILIIFFAYAITAFVFGVLVKSR